MLYIFPLLLLCGCAAKDTVNIRLTDSSYQTDTADVYAQGAEFSGMKDTAFEEALNASIASDIDGALVSFDTIAAQSAQNIRMGNKCVFRLTQEVKYNKNDFVSIIEEHYIYAGGAHGSSKRYPRNIDAAASKTIALADLFEDGYEETLNRMITELLEKYPERYSELWEKPHILPCHQSDFYIDDSSLVIFFQPYDLSYYAKGYVEFPLKLKELKGYMKEEYRRLTPEGQGS